MGPGSAPALSGPTWSAPTESMRAMVPPPALTVWMSSMGRLMGRWLMRPWVVTTGRPWWISATSQLVPPMSKVMMLSMPTLPLAPSDEITPPAGPDSTVATGMRAEVLKVETPPLDCMM